MQGLILFLFFLSPGPAHSPITSVEAAKSITITIDQRGHAFMGRDTLALDELAEELKRRLWKGYLGTGKMYGSIHLKFSGDVVNDIRSSAANAIKEAQKNALTDVCLHLHKKRYEALTSRQKIKIKTQFPVLFQSDYH